MAFRWVRTHWWHSPLPNLSPGSVLYWYCSCTRSRNTLRFLSKSGRGDLSPSLLPGPSRELRGFAKRLAGVRAEPTLWPDLNLNSVLFDQPFLGILTTCQAYAKRWKNRNKWDLARLLQGKERHEMKWSESRSVWLFVPNSLWTPWTIESMEFSWPEY